MTAHDSATDRLTGVLDLMRQSLKASAAVIYWIDRPLGTPIAHRGFRGDFFPGYDAEHGWEDPIGVDRVVKRGSRIAYLKQTVNHVASRYTRFMEDAGFSDAMTMVLSDADAPMIGIGVMKAHDDPPVDPETTHVADAIQTYLERDLIYNPAIRRRYVDRKLSHRFGLSPREREVVTLIADGAANHDIAVALGIAPATVKTHLMRSFDKLGVGSRSAAMRMLLEPNPDVLRG